MILFGGYGNALSVAGSLARRGIKVRVVCRPHSEVRFSRHATRIPLPDDQPFLESAIEFLLGDESKHLEGSVLLAVGDPQLEVMGEHRDALAKKFRMDPVNLEAQEVMLDKLLTYEAAREAGVPTPKFWKIASSGDIESVRDELVYPLIVKPKTSHLFSTRFGGKKFFFAKDFSELKARFGEMEQFGIEAVLVEMIPGPDSRLCSYYTYMDESGDPQFHFTKRIIRRYPVNMGFATYHITDHVEGVAEHSLRLLRHVGLQGLANPEFKLDVRDNQLKLIECNVRYTAANALVDKAGYDLANFVYNRIVGIDQPPLENFRTGLRLWDPVQDFRAFLELRHRGEMTFIQWLRSVCHRQNFNYFSLGDPLPFFCKLWKRGGTIRKKLTAQFREAPEKEQAEAGQLAPEDNLDLAEGALNRPLTAE